MKKNIFFIAFFAFIANFAIGQMNDSPPLFNIGIKAGANFANVYDGQGDEFRADGKLGFVAGGFMAIPLGGLFGLQPEVLFSQKGFKATGSLLGINYGLTRTSNFLDIPLYITIKPLPVLTILAGPQFSYLMKSTDEYNSTTGSAEQIQEFDNDNLRKNILGGALGIDVNLHPFVIGLRAGWDVYNNNGDGTSNTPRYKNSWVQTTLGYRFL